MRNKLWHLFGLTSLVLFVGGVAWSVGGGSTAIIAAPQAAPAAINDLLDKVRVVESRPNVPGYDRDCDHGHACVFGPAWQEFKELPGRNGCDTRNDVLKRDLVDDAYKPGTNDCVVLRGTLEHDPYTGREIRFLRSTPLEIQIDHIYPLALAWDMGANQWAIEQRRTFANDAERNLLAVSGDANHDKSDQGPSTWLVPDNPSYRCTYITKYLFVAVYYDLPITKADEAAIRKTAGDC